MEHGRRPFQPVRMEMIGAENGLERFRKDETTTLPPVAKWRNNLTALSQHENLFFIASGHCITVYQPEFPYQTLRRTPSLLIIPELAEPRARGYLSHGESGNQGHCINHLIVGDLGSQEILLFATDSGNVEAYYISSIAVAVRRALESTSPGCNSDVLGLRPFFSQWVYQSAWGLDIHTDARMVAVSANTPSEHQPGTDADASAKITVFAFALSAPFSSTSSDDEPDDGLDTEWIAWNAKPTKGQPKRDRNYRITLAGIHGHEHNIPNIQFASTLDADGGAWLLSTDINGHMKLWQVWKGACFRTWFFESAGATLRPWLHREYPGWNVAALEVNSFRTARTNEEFVGVSRAPNYHGFHGRGESFNLSPSVSHIAGNSTLHPSQPGPNSPEPRSDADQIVDENSDHDEENFDVSDVSEDARSDTTGLLPPNWREMFLNRRNTGRLEQVQSEIPIGYDDEAYLENSFRSEQSRGEEIASPDQPIQFTIETDTDDSDYDEDAGSNDSIEEEIQLSPPPESRWARRTRRVVTPLQNPNVQTPDIAIIHCSDSHIRLLGSPKQNYPHIFCANVLKQLIPHDMITTRQGFEFVHMDRLNMLHKIPELGVLLIATQAGRVAVCALTRRPDKLLGFRVDGILPTRKQEQQGRRPNLCTLVGMAVAPIQGQWGSESTTTSEEHTFEDGVVDGVHTSFDKHMVVLRHQATPQERHAWGRQRVSPPPLKFEYMPWTKAPEESPSWQTVDTSRRYRVMLTYSDLSVLTYEIWRDVEQNERAQADLRPFP